MGRAGRQDTKSLLREYVPGADHSALVLEAIEIWSYGPGTLHNPKLALAHQSEMGRVREDSLEHMERVRDAFFYEAERGDPGEGPFYRGHDGISDGPHEGIFSWSRDPRIAFIFAAVQPFIDGPHGRRKAPALETILEEGLELEKGESLYITGFVADGAKAGVNINHNNQELLRDSALQNIAEGKSVSINVMQNGKKEIIEFEAEKLKRAVYLAAVRKAGSERVRRALGVGNLSETALIDFVSRRSLAQMNSFLHRLGEESVSRIWRDRTEKVQEAIQQADSVTPISQYATEEEIVVPAHLVEGMRRIDVCLASSSKEIAELSEKRAEELFVNACSSA